MIIGYAADALYIRLVFRSTGSAADVVRAVDLSWQEAEELLEHLTVALKQHAQSPTEQNRGRNLSAAKNDRE